MDFSPQTVRSAGFKTVKKGYDPAEVNDFKEKVAAAIETAQNQATAMEARARAAVAKLQEVSQQVSSGPRDAGQPTPQSDEDVETISRTLLLAQRTADHTIAQANNDAESITVKARIDATTVIDNARAMADKLLDDARLEARRSAESERIKAENEVQALLARRDFLLSDVDHLEHHIGAQRERLRDAAISLQDLVERVPGGLGEMRRPLLSASGEGGGGSSLPKPTELPAPTPEVEDNPRPYETVTFGQFANNEQPPADERGAAVDPTPAEAAVSADNSTDNAADDGTVMRLDLDMQSAPRPSWSLTGGDPLMGGDELQ